MTSESTVDATPRPVQPAPDLDVAEASALTWVQRRNSVPAAMRLVAAVHSMDMLTVDAMIERATSNELNAWLVILAGMVDLDRSPRDMLAWAEENRGRDVFTTAITLAAEALTVSVDAILSRSQELDPTRARLITCWLLAAQGWEYKRIGRHLGRDHSTVMSNVDRVTTTEELYRIALGLHAEMPFALKLPAGRVLRHRGTRRRPEYRHTPA